MQGGGQERWGRWGQIQGRVSQREGVRGRFVCVCVCVCVCVWCVCVRVWCACVCGVCGVCVCVCACVVYVCEGVGAGPSS